MNPRGITFVTSKLICDRYKKHERIILHTPE